MLRKFQCNKCSNIIELVHLWSELEKILKEEKDKWGYIKHQCDFCLKKTKHYMVVMEAPTLQGVRGRYQSMENWWKSHPEEFKRKTEEIQKEKAIKNEIIKKRLNKQAAPKDSQRAQRHEGYGPGNKENKLKLD